MLRRRADRLDQRGWARLRDRLDAGDPDGEVTVVWVIAQLRIAGSSGGASGLFKTY